MTLDFCSLRYDTRINDISFHFQKLRRAAHKCLLIIPLLFFNDQHERRVKGVTYYNRRPTFVTRTLFDF